MRKNISETDHSVAEIPGKMEIWRGLTILLQAAAKRVGSFVTILTEIVHRDNNFVRKLHEYEKLCCLTKRFWDTTAGIVKHSQKPAKNLVYLFYCERLGGRL